MKLNYTYKQLNVLLVLVTVFVLLVIYNYNVKPTLGLYRECETMRNDLKKIDNAETKLEQLKSIYKKVNAVAGNSKLNNDEIRQVILAKTNSYVKNAFVYSIKEPHVFETNNAQVVTHLLELEGDFKELVKVVNDLENGFKEAKLASIKLFSLVDNRTKKIKLYGLLYFQNYKKI